jgi:hypothetical protein
MASTIFNAKINVSNATLITGDSWTVDFTLSDGEGLYSGLDVAIGDRLYLDTSPWTVGTITAYSITSIGAQTAGAVTANIALSDNNPGVDLTFCTGLDSFISRPTPNHKLSIDPSPGIQGLPDKFVTYVRNTDFSQIVDNLNAGPKWIEYPFTFSSFSAAALSNSIALFTLAPKQIIEKVLIKHSTSFFGGSISSYTIEVGVSLISDKYASAFNVFQTVAASTSQMSNVACLEDLVGSVAIQVTARSIGGNLNTATSGAASVWVQTSQLP